MIIGHWNNGLIPSLSLSNKGTSFIIVLLIVERSYFFFSAVSVYMSCLTSSIRYADFVVVLGHTRACDNM